MIKNGSTRRAMRHLHRAQELLDSHGFGSDAEYEQDNPRENDFGGIKDWLINAALYRFLMFRGIVF